MKKLIVIISLMIFASCKNSDPQETIKLLESRKWNMTGWPGEKEVVLAGGNRTNHQARFSAGLLIMSNMVEGPESEFNAHGYEVLPGSLNLDSCHTYEIKNNIVKISSHDHGGKSQTFYYKIFPEKEQAIKLVQVTEKDF